MRIVLLIALGIVIGSTLSAIIAVAWTAPTASPPGNNVSSPVNVGNVMQLKNGTLGVNGLGVFGNTMLSGTNGDGTGNGVNSYLNFGATAGQSGYGIRDNNGTLEFRNSSGSWGSLNTMLINLMQVNGITPNVIGQITSIKFGDGTTQTTAGWAANGANIYNTNSGFVGVGTSNPISPLTIQTSGETDELANDITFIDYTDAPINIGLIGDRARGTAANPKAVQANDILLSIVDHLYNGSTFLTRTAGAGIYFSAEANATPTSYPTYISLVTTPPNSTGPFERMRITGNGYVGINTTSPQTPLDLQGSMTERNELNFIDENPSNGVGQQFNINNWDGTMSISNVTSGYAYQNTRFSLDAGGNEWVSGYVNATAFYPYSDARLKTNIQTFPDALQVIKQLRGVTFDWKKDGTPGAGVIAQEVEKVMPSAVKTDTNGIKSVDYDQLIAPLIEAVKEQQNQIDALTKKTDAQAQETDTQRLCIGSGTTRTCITQQQLAALLASQANSKSQ